MWVDMIWYSVYTIIIRRRGMNVDAEAASFAVVIDDV